MQAIRQPAFQRLETCPELQRQGLQIRPDPKPIARCQLLVPNVLSQGQSTEFSRPEASKAILGGRKQRLWQELLFYQMTQLSHRCLLWG